MLALKGKVALVTGGTSGIGRGCIERLASEGASIIFNGIQNKNESVDSIRKSIHDKYKTDIFYHSSDLTKLGEIEELFEKSLKRFSKIDILVNNAGITLNSPTIDQMPLTDLNFMINLNLMAPIHTCRLVIPIMLKNNWGRIINISSVMGLVGGKGSSGYNATKHGLIGLTKGLALELGDKNITVNAICPGSVSTPMLEMVAKYHAKQQNSELSDDLHKKFMEAKCVTKKFIEPEEVANLVAFLCGKHTQNITGASYAIDGGYLAH